MAETCIFAEQSLTGFEYDPAYAAYVCYIDVGVNLSVGYTYTVYWNHKPHTCKAQTVGGISGVLLGNLSSFPGGIGNNEPFVIGFNAYGGACYSFDEIESVDVSIYESSENIVTRDWDGTQVEHPDIETVSFYTNTGGIRVFSRGVAVENVPVSLDFTNGDQIIAAEDDILVKSAIIAKPESLVPENIAKGIKIAGIEGAFIGDTEEIEVELNLAKGNQVVLPSEDDKVFSQVTIKKPDTLVPENIVKDVEIAGVVGTSEGGGGGGEEFEDISKYFLYNVNSRDNTVTLYRILYSQIYEDTGTYDVTIPDTIAGMQVIIRSSYILYN